MPNKKTGRFPPPVNPADGMGRMTRGEAWEAESTSAA